MLRILTVLSLALFSIAPALADTVQYDAVNDFSATSNPNGAWSYLMDGTSFTVRSCPIAAGIICWWNGGEVPDSPSISKNITNSPVRENGTVLLSPDVLNMDGESILVTTRWTAPSAGTWYISGYFSGIDTVAAAHPVSVVFDSSTTLFSTTIDQFGQQSTFSFSLNLNPGDMLDFNVHPANRGYFLGTGFDATISIAPIITPEPASLGLLLLGLGGASLMRRYSSR